MHDQHVTSYSRFVLIIAACTCRDDARTVLVAMAVELGLDYLPFVVEVLQSALPARGYTAHVLGFTLHSVLDAVAKVWSHMTRSCCPMRTCIHALCRSPIPHM